MTQEHPQKKGGKKKKRKKKVSKGKENLLTDKLELKKDYGNPEINKMMERIREIDADIKNKIAHLCEISGHTPKEVENFLNDNGNFSDDFLKLIKDDQQEWAEKVFGEGAKEFNQIHEKTEQMKKAKKRLRKTVGRRKNWIPMD